MRPQECSLLKAINIYRNLTDHQQIHNHDVYGNSPRQITYRWPLKAPGHLKSELCPNTTANTESAAACPLQAFNMSIWSLSKYTHKRQDDTMMLCPLSQSVMDTQDTLWMHKPAVGIQGLTVRSSWFLEAEGCRHSCDGSSFGPFSHSTMSVCWLHERMAHSPIAVA